MKFYKILNENENHHEFQFKTGLNVDPIPFNPSGSCEPGGIYFSREDILAFLNYGPWIREVTPPQDAQIYEDPSSNPKKWKADKVILGRKFKIGPKIIQKLIDEGADVHVFNDYALRWAANNSRIEIVKILLENGADVHAEDDYALRWAANYGRIEIVKILLKNGANVHTEDDEALRWAANNGHLEVVKILLENGADVHAGNDWALRWATYYGRIEVVKFLLENGVDVHAENDKALRETIKKEDTKVIKIR